jgi:hypothetical protein
MRAVFVNYVHPNHPHVSSMRLRFFAEALAKKGHQIILLTATENIEDKVKSPEQVEEELSKHDWSHFYHLACPSVKIGSLDALRKGKLPSLIRQVVVAWHYLINDGVFCDWTKGSRPYWPAIIRTFKPTVTLGTFGNTDSLSTAQGIAKSGVIPWAIDMKDSWDKFIPSVLRSIMARRFKDAKALTTNSVFLEKKVNTWFPQNPTVIYSGISTSTMNQVETKNDNKFRIALIGSIYNQSNLRKFIEGLFRWLEHLNPIERDEVVFTYAGAEIKTIQEATLKLGNKCKLELFSYLDLKDYYQLCSNSSINCFLWADSTFHHKIVEFIYFRKPIIVFPKLEGEEKFLASKTKTKLFQCTNKDELKNCIQEIWLDRNKSKKDSDQNQLNEFTWDSQSIRLETIL